MTHDDDDRSPTLADITASIHGLERAVRQLADDHHHVLDYMNQTMVRTQEALAGIEAVAKDLWCYDPSPGAGPELFSTEDIPF